MVAVAFMTENDIVSFNNKKVVIVGLSRRAKAVCDIYKFYKIEIEAFVTAGTSRPFQKYHGVPIVSMKQLKQSIHKNDNLIIQMTDSIAEKEEAIRKNFSLYNFQFSPFSSGQIILGLYPIVANEILKDPSIYKYKLRKWQDECRKSEDKGIKRFWRSKPRNPILLCLPPKTADYALLNTFHKANTLKLEWNINNHLYERLHSAKKLFKRSFLTKAYQYFIRSLDKIGENINFHMLWHKPRYINKTNRTRFSKIKIITAIREPISQNISTFYHGVSEGGILLNWILGEIEHSANVEATLNQLKNRFSSYEGDMQKWFEGFINSYVYSENTINATIAWSIQEFVRQFNEQVVNLFNHPFDQEAGYTIIKEGNTEVFVYQLEKLNDIVPQLSEWVGVPFDKLEKGNVGEDKWIGESYKQAQKEIKITQEYFDRCFNEPYVKHFYSEADIEKFKAKWRPHIK